MDVTSMPEAQNFNDIKSIATRYMNECDMESVTIKDVLLYISNTLSLKTDFFLENRDLKRQTKEFIKQYVSKQVRNSQENKNKKSVRNPKRKRVSNEVTSKTVVSKNLKKLNKLARLSGKAPAIFTGLPNDECERTKALSEKLRSSGVAFEGLVPNQEEIMRAQKLYESKKDLEGLDESNILQSNRRKRKTVNYSKEIEINFGSDDESEEDSQTEEQNNEPEEESDGFVESSEDESE